MNESFIITENKTVKCSLSIMTENYETHLTSLYKTHCDVGLIELNSAHSI